MIRPLTLLIATLVLSACVTESSSNHWGSPYMNAASGVAQNIRREEQRTSLKPVVEPIKPFKSPYVPYPPTTSTSTSTSTSSSDSANNGTDSSGLQLIRTEYASPEAIYGPNDLDRDGLDDDDQAEWARQAEITNNRNRATNNVSKPKCLKDCKTADK